MTFWEAANDDCFVERARFQNAADSQSERFALMVTIEIDKNRDNENNRERERDRN